MFGERIIALQLAARGLSRGHSKYKKVLLVGAYAPVSSAPEGERELFLRNLQAAVESAERDALLVVGGDFNAQLGVRQPDSLVGVRDTTGAWSVWDSACQQSRRGFVGCAGVL